MIEEKQKKLGRYGLETGRIKQDYELVARIEF